MTPSKTRLQAKAAKQRRQKMFAIGGAVVLLLLLAIQVPRTLKMLHGNSATPAAPATATSPAATTSEPGTPLQQNVQAVAASTGGELSDVNAAPKPDEGQLTGFSLFQSKDPFVQQVASESDQPAVGSAASQTGSAAGGAGNAPSQSTGGVSGNTQQSPRSVSIAVNGTVEKVQVSQKFPADDPTFVLVSSSSRSARIAIAGGKLADGSGSVTLRLGRKLTLVNTVDGTRYQLELRSAG